MSPFLSPSLCQLVKRAHDAVHHLFMEAHELGCDGVGRRPERLGPYVCLTGDHSDGDPQR
jgi:hypothetical protein